MLLWIQGPSRLEVGGFWPCWRRSKNIDSDVGRVSIWAMKAMVTLALLFLVALGAQGQQQQSKGSTSSSGNRFRSPVNERLVKEIVKEMEANHASANPSASVGRHLRISGPVVRVFKGAKIWNVPRRLFQVVNPFAPSEHMEAVPRSRDLNPNAWASSVGWGQEGITLIAVSWH